MDRKQNAKDDTRHHDISDALHNAMWSHGWLDTVTGHPPHVIRRAAELGITLPRCYSKQQLAALEMATRVAHVSDVGTDVGTDGTHVGTYLGTDVDTDHGTDVGTHVGTDANVSQIKALAPTPNVGAKVGAKVGANMSAKVGAVGAKVSANVGANVSANAPTPKAAALKFLNWLRNTGRTGEHTPSELDDLYYMHCEQEGVPALPAKRMREHLNGNGIHRAKVDANVNGKRARLTVWHIS